MKRAIDPDDGQFLERLHRLGSGTIQEICADLGVTATAVRQRLTRLQAQGLITRQLDRGTDGQKARGRPHHTYQVSETGRRELGENYAELTSILWREIQEIEEPEVRSRVLGRVKDALVQRYGAEVAPGAGGSLADRLRQLCGTLVEHGFDVEYDAGGELPILRENNCPYLELASSDPSICELEQAVFHQVLGVKVSLTQCCLDGHHCCEFQAEERSEERAQKSRGPGDGSRKNEELFSPDA